MSSKLTNAVEILSMCFVAGCTSVEASTILHQHAQYPWNQMKPAEIQAHWMGEISKARQRLNPAAPQLARMGIPAATVEGPLQRRSNA
jgi:hypothetical protein